MPVVFASETEVMRHALQLAARGLGHVEPNPAVGAVIVDEALQLLGEGWHQQFGGPHAEVHALQQAGAAARGATLFVTLEPCCHFGKTPPCSQAVITAGIRRVVVAQQDPAPHVNGGGIAELRAAGIVVDVGLCESEARRLTGPFVKLMTTGRPWVHAKWAMTLDGKIASQTGHSQWITSPASRAAVHQLRGRMDAIVVGIGTALADNPALTARPAGARVPLRVVIDSHARLPLDSQLVRTAREIPVLCITADDAPEDSRQALQAQSVDVLILPRSASGRIAPVDWLQQLGTRRLTNVFVEGGGQLLGSLRDADAIDEVHTFIAPKLVGGEHAPSPMAGVGAREIPATGLYDSSIQRLEDDVYFHGWTRPV